MTLGWGERSASGGMPGAGSIRGTMSAEDLPEAPEGGRAIGEARTAARRGRALGSGATRPRRALEVIDLEGGEQRIRDYPDAFGHDGSCITRNPDSPTTRKDPHDA